MLQPSNVFCEETPHQRPPVAAAMAANGAERALTLVPEHGNIAATKYSVN